VEQNKNYLSTFEKSGAKQKLHFSTFEKSGAKQKITLFYL
jgi:hypothetical protein